MNHYLGRFNKTIWLIGDGRSGTTWVSSLINHDKKCREMFEPIHPELIEESSFLELHQYVKPGLVNPRLESLVNSILSGKFQSCRVDRDNKKNLLYNGLIVKDIFANLFAYWAFLKNRNVQVVLLVRHPFSVALSKAEKKDWLWETDPMSLMNQDTLFTDYLFPHKSLIEEIVAKENYILNQVLIWAIINYVPLKQFSKGELVIVFYENFVLDANKELSKLIGFENIQIDEQIIINPSKVTKKSSSEIQNNLFKDWNKLLTPIELKEGMRILQEFGFEDLYDQNSLPNPTAQVLKKFS